MFVLQNIIPGMLAVISFEMEKLFWKLSLAESSFHVKTFFLEIFFYNKISFPKVISITSFPYVMKFYEKKLHIDRKRKSKSLNTPKKGVSCF